MQETLTVVAIQANLVWENSQKNLESFEKTIDELSSEVDLVVLPEMFSTGFTMQPKMMAEPMNGTTVDWMKRMATSKNTAIVGSVVIEENNNYHNRAIFVHPDGSIETYDKRHSFSLAGEDEEYTSGTEKLIIDYKGWKLFPLICYDLRFPVWSRFNDDYEVLLYMANWPKPRIVAWDSLLKARAIENMSYCIGVNRVGEDKNGYEYIGHTTAYDYLGKEIATTQEGEEGYLQITLHKSGLNETRKKLNFLNDRDQFTIKG
ncbi:amidohydrolase [Pseudotenacibaculum haliotis]|uniref:Amidohydrolase n=1 Tax=Pseudotenacibaculum haliotis TaxID=1862138 RepID=A0ABW5LPL5_9FLAO